MSNQPNHIQIEDDETFQPGGSLGIREIALEQYRRCMVESSKEMVRGGWTKRIFGDQVQEIEIPNQRLVFINCVKAMETILIPFLTDEEISELQQLQAIEDTYYNDYYTELDKCKRGLTTKTYDGGFQFSNNQYEKYGILIEDAFEKRRVRLYRKMLIFYGKVIRRLNYFGEGGASA